MLRIDAHVHIGATGPIDGLLFDELNLKLLNICVVTQTSATWRTCQAEMYRRMADRNPRRWAWCTGFVTPTAAEFNSDYADRVIADLERDFAAGAVAVKIWKNVGMEDRTPAGDFLHSDDSVFDPIYAWLTKHERPLLMHIAEPLACWLPLDPASPHYGYYCKNPKWHMHGREDIPSHATIIAARDRMMAKHPNLRVIGAHFGSMEYDLNEIAKRLDAFPNFAVDTSARLADFAMHDRTKCIDFIERYQDRILWGTDPVIGPPKEGESDAERQKVWAWMRSVYETEFAFYGSGADVTINKQTRRGLGLSELLQQKLFADNARRWYLGL